MKTLSTEENQATPLGQRVYNVNNVFIANKLCFHWDNKSQILQTGTSPN